MSQSPKKIALVHDFLLAYGGAERVLQVLADMYPEAPIYTLLENKEMSKRFFPNRDIRTSFLQKFPLFFRKRHHWLLPFYPIAVETLDLRDFDLVISSSGAWSKGIVTRLKTRHLAYLHSPMRFVWDSFHGYAGLTGKRKILRRLVLGYLRLWDKEAAARPDALLTNSEYTRRRIQKFYRLDAAVLYPPVSMLPAIQKEGKKKFFLVVSRLTEAKKIDVAIDAFNKLGFPLFIVGEGSYQKKLEKMAQKNIVFLNTVSDEELATLYSEAWALIQPSEEDFGLVAAEALSLGTPTIANKKGAAAEIIVPGVTGEFFEGDSAEALADAVRRFSGRIELYNKEEMKKSVEKFSRVRFIEGVQKAVSELLEQE